MRTASVRDLRNRFRLISKWIESGDSVQVLKRGKPFARVVPERPARTFVGACVTAQPLPPDLDEPLAVHWDAER